MTNFDHKEIISGQKIQLCCFKADLAEIRTSCSTDNDDCQGLGFKTQLGQLMTNFEHKKIISGQKNSTLLF